MHSRKGGDDDKDEKKNEQAGPESGDYTLPDEIGERVGEGEDHNPANLGNL